MRRDILERIRDEFNKGVYIKEFKVGGHRYTLRLLTAEDEIWRDKHVPVGAYVAVLTARKLATLAIALVAIDGESIEVIFGDNEENKKVGEEEMIRDMVMGDVEKKYEIAELVYKFLGELPGYVINTLFDKYTELENERNSGLQSFLQ
jgi:hypothetical protein